MRDAGSDAVRHARDESCRRRFRRETAPGNKFDGSGPEVRMVGY